MALEISDIVRVTAQIRPRGALRTELGRTLFLTTDDSVLAPGGAGKVRTYARFSDLSDDFDSDSEPYKAGNVYFQQDPFPRNLLVGRWLQVAVNSQLRGSAPVALATLQAVTTGAFRLNGADFIGIDLSGDGSLAAVASSLQTELRAGSGAPAAATATIADGSPVVRVDITNGGSGYTGTPAVAFNGGGGNSAAGTAIVVGGVVTGVEITNGGADYTSAPAITFTGGGGNSAAGTAVLGPRGINTVTITSGGAGYTSPPEVTFTGGAGTGASVQAIISGGSVTGVNIIDGGSGYTSAPTAVTFSGGGRLAYTDATVSYSAVPSRFTVDFGGTADNGGSFSAPGTGTDISSLLGLSASSGAAYEAGGAVETVQDALDNIAAVDDSFYFVTVESAYNGSETMRAISAWTGARENMFSAESNETGALTAQESATELAQMSALRSGRTFATWSETVDYKAMSIAARFSSVNFDAPGSIITGKFKSLPGTTPDSITATQKQELDRKMCNHYSPYGGDAIFGEGWTFEAGTWIDVRYWIDWLVGAIRVDVYNLLRSSPRIPQTPAGLATIKTVIERACRQGVRNGGIAGGPVSPGMALDIRNSTGDLGFDGNLTNGYLVYVTPLSEQSQAQRESREAPPFRVWLKGSGAVHYASIDLTFEN